MPQSRRHRAEEILRRQKSEDEAIDAELTMHALAGKQDFDPQDNKYESLIEIALNELDDAVKDMLMDARTHNYLLSLCKPPKFTIAKGIVWPHARQSIRWFSMDCRGRSHEIIRMAREILDACQWQPRLVLQAYRWIQKAIAWCKAQIK